MRQGTQDIDSQLASALRTGAVPSVQQCYDGAEARLVEDRAHFHGVSGLLVGLPGWPAEFAASIRAEALGRAMWELRHRQLLSELLGRLADEGLRALLIKGTALAYDLYEEPAHRIRGDSDLWVDEAEVGRVRHVLRQLYYRTASNPEEASTEPLQEGWVGTASDGSEHVIDLHWSAVNSGALKQLFLFDDCWARRRPLPRLARGGWGLDHADALLHSAVHRGMHTASPYNVGSTTHYGGDRLIWIWDIHLLASALGDQGIMKAADRASTLGLEAPLRSALSSAKNLLGTSVQDSLLDRLGLADSSLATRYLEGGQVKRAWLDLQQVRPLSRKLATISRRLFPSTAFLGSKYGGASKAAASSLYLRRMIEFVRRRPDQTRP